MNKSAIIIGGTFNPITTAHLQMGILAKMKFPFADIIYVPTNIKFISKWKFINNDQMFSDTIRLKFIYDTINSYGFLYSCNEISGETDGTTYQTVQYIRSLGYKNIYISVGFDKIDEIPHWSHSKELMDNSNLILFSRNNQSKSDITNDLMIKYLDKITEIIMPDEFQYISSTKVRDAYNNNCLYNVKYMISDVVFQYLETYKNKE